jgi:Fe-S cluster assembly iron-binding protein IscA
MLTITHEAATSIAQERTTSGSPDSYGVRFFARSLGEGAAPQLAMSFVPEAALGDEVTEQEGITAFVAPEVSDALDEATLDLIPTDGSPQLVVRR